MEAVKSVDVELVATEECMGTVVAGELREVDSETIGTIEEAKDIN